MDNLKGMKRWKSMCKVLGYNPDSDFGRGFRDGWFNYLFGNVAPTYSQNEEYNKGYSKGKFYANEAFEAFYGTLC